MLGGRILTIQKKLFLTCVPIALIALISVGLRINFTKILSAEVKDLSVRSESATY